MEEDNCVREKDYNVVVDEVCCVEQKVNDKVKNFENVLENVSQDNSDLKLKLFGLEGCIIGLEV